MIVHRRFHSVLPMKTFKVELSPKVESINQPHHVFMTISECIDIDDCINHIHHNHPALQIESIKEVTNDTA
jgi:hypothetical protein